MLTLLVFLPIFSVVLGENDTVPKSGVPLITGGSDTHNRDHSKNIVSLRFGNLPENYWGANHLCGGTLIGADLVLTAAHCLVNPMTNETVKPHELTIVTGSPYRLKKTPTTVELKVREVIRHELYKIKSGHDIGLVKLEQRATEVFKESAEILPLNDRPLEANMRCTIAGWGSIFNKGISPPILLYANVTVWSLLQCKIMNPIVFLYSGVICVNDEEDTHLGGSACHGDSGGPLICNGQLAGVTSFGRRGVCGGKGRPAVYTDVYYYHRWIARNSADKLQMPSFIIVVMTVILLPVNLK